MNIIEKDILTVDRGIICHQTNCQGVMGSGVAKALYEKWPKVRYSYMDCFTEFNAGVEGENFLGEVDDIQMHPGGKVVVNCFTQQYFGGDGRLYLSCEALRTCMKNLIKVCEYHGVDEVAMPKIGCGLAGGDWNKVKTILEDVFPKDFKVKIYIK